MSATFSNCCRSLSRFPVIHLPKFNDLSNRHPSEFLLRLLTLVFQHQHPDKILQDSQSSDDRDAKSILRQRSAASVALADTFLKALISPAETHIEESVSGVDKSAVEADKHAHRDEGWVTAHSSEAEVVVQMCVAEAQTDSESRTGKAIKPEHRTDAATGSAAMAPDSILQVLSFHVAFSFVSYFCASIRSCEGRLFQAQRNCFPLPWCYLFLSANAVNTACIAQRSHVKP